MKPLSPERGGIARAPPQLASHLYGQGTCCALFTATSFGPRSTDSTCHAERGWN